MAWTVGIIVVLASKGPAAQRALHIDQRHACTAICNLEDVMQEKPSTSTNEEIAHCFVDCKRRSRCTLGEDLLVQASKLAPEGRFDHFMLSA
jgi:hypothetical protein